MTTENETNISKRSYWTTVDNPYHRGKKGKRGCMAKCANNRCRYCSRNTEILLTEYLRDIGYQFTGKELLAMDRDLKKWYREQAGEPAKHMVSQRAYGRYLKSIVRGPFTCGQIHTFFQRHHIFTEAGDKWLLGIDEASHEV